MDDFIEHIYLSAEWLTAAICQHNPLEKVINTNFIFFFPQWIPDHPLKYCKFFPANKPTFQNFTKFVYNFST